MSYLSHFLILLAFQFIETIFLCLLKIVNVYYSKRVRRRNVYVFNLSLLSLLLFSILFLCIILFLLLNIIFLNIEFYYIQFDSQKFQNVNFEYLIIIIKIYHCQEITFLKVY